jgi:hypothetical protein
MSEEQNLSEQNIEKKNQKPEDVNENISQKQPIEKSETINPKSEIQKPNRKHGSTSSSRSASQKETLERIFS